MIRSLAAAATALVAVAAATTLSVAPAQAAGYSATIKTSATKVDVTKTFTISGKVTGKGSGSKTLTVQRKVGTAAWKKLTTVRTTTKGAYSKKLTVGSAGAKQYRVVAPKSGKTTAGVSPAVTVTGWAWVDLYDQSYLTDGVVIRGWAGQLNGKTPPAHTFAISDQSLIVWSLQNRCDKMTGALEMANDGSATQVVRVEADGISANHTVDAGAKVAVTSSLVGASSLRVQRTGTSSYLALEAPKAHCSVAVLPTIID